MTRNLNFARLLPAIVTAAACVVFLLAPTSVQAGETVNIYSYRQPELIKPLLDEFTKATGINTKIIFAKKGLGERVNAEGINSPADVLFTVDIGRLDGAKKLGITQAVQSETINQNIPAQYRDVDGHWIGLTTRARLIFASRDRVAQNTITYEELADPKWKGRICTRSGQHVYSIGLIASMIAHHGVEKAEKWLTGVKQNLAGRPAGNDRKQVKAIFAGKCDISLGNHYYMGKMLTNTKEPVQKEWASSVKLLFPNAENRGTHVNISGVAMAKHAPNPENAKKLLEFLASETAQTLYAKVNFEYPVKTSVAVDALVKSFGKLKADKLSLTKIANNRRAASEMVDRVGFDNGPSS